MNLFDAMLAETNNKTSSMTSGSQRKKCLFYIDETLLCSAF